VQGKHKESRRELDKNDADPKKNDELRKIRDAVAKGHAASS